VTDILPDFQKFLIERKLVQQKHIPFYALWASRFMSFSNKNQDKEPELRIRLFLDSLTKEQKLEDWQVERADNCSLFDFCTARE
jgi:hypothetical protein